MKVFKHLNYVNNTNQTFYVNKTVFLSITTTLILSDVKTIYLITHNINSNL